MQALAKETSERMRDSLNDDLNTAQAQAAMFEMVRRGNAVIDSGEFKAQDVEPLLDAIKQFDDIFAVLTGDDAAKMKQVFDWAPGEGRDQDISAALREVVEAGQLSDSDIERKITDMEGARKSRNFKVSDALRGELTGAGIVIENTKEGVRWRRK